jgi:hypothetical protein
MHGRDEYKIVVGKCEVKGQIGTLRSKWENNTKTEFKEMGVESVNWVHLAQDRDQRHALENTVISLRFP